MSTRAICAVNLIDYANFCAINILYFFLLPILKSSPEPTDEEMMFEEALENLNQFSNSFYEYVLSKFTTRGFEAMVPAQLDIDNYSPHPQPQASMQVCLFGQSLDSRSDESICLKMVLSCFYSDDGNWSYTLTINSAKMFRLFAFNSGQASCPEDIWNSKRFVKYYRRINLFCIRPLRDGSSDQRVQQIQTYSLGAFRKTLLEN